MDLCNLIQLEWKKKKIIIIISQLGFSIERTHKKITPNTMQKIMIFEDICNKEMKDNNSHFFH